MRLGFWSGWLTAACIVLAAIVPILHRLRNARRAAPESRTTAVHVALGAGVAVLAFTHALFSLFALGSESTIESGDLALAAGGGAIFVLVAHAGIGLQLKNPKIRDRAKKRRIHVGTATTIVVLVIVHAVLLLRAS